MEMKMEAHGQLLSIIQNLSQLKERFDTLEIVDDNSSAEALEISERIRSYMEAIANMSLPKSINPAKEQAISCLRELEDSLKKFAINIADM